jgi:hypothetical protein
MDGTSRDDIRSLLKQFGIQADEAVVTHLARNPGVNLKLRLELKDLTEYGATAPGQPLALALEGEVRAG